MDRAQKGELHGKKQKKKQKFTGQFIGNKESGQGFADKRKKKAFYEYKKMMSKVKVAQGHKQTSDNTQSATVKNSRKDKQSATKFSRFSKAQQKSIQDRQEKIQKKEEVAQKHKRQQEALDKYKKHKTERDRKLCKKNFKGQPIMKNQIEFLLQRIQDQS